MEATRRQFLEAGSMTILGALAPNAVPRRLDAMPFNDAQATASRTAKDLGAVKALTFDTFGTVVDYRSTIIAEGEALNKAKGLKVDWAKFADEWRAGYAPAMDRVRKGEIPWTKLDALHRIMLDKVMIDFGVKGRLSEAETEHLNRVWHRLRPWPDAVAGLTRLKKKYIIAPLSNGNVSLMTDLAKHARLPWDLILGAELARHYKPDKEVYLTAAELLSLTPPEIMMVAARTAFVPRPKEGPNGEHNFTPDPVFDVVAPDFNALATALGT
jgi:2-haloacid dehalogenase